VQETLGGEGEFPAVLSQDTEALAFEFQDDATEEALFLKKFHQTARFHVGQKLTGIPGNVNEDSFRLKKQQDKRSLIC
jgi:hypothetical protein